MLCYLLCPLLIIFLTTPFFICVTSIVSVTVLVKWFFERRQLSDFNVSAFPSLSFFFRVAFSSLLRCHCISLTWKQFCIEVFLYTNAAVCVCFLLILCLFIHYQALLWILTCLLFKYLPPVETGFNFVCFQLSSVTLLLHHAWIVLSFQGF